MATTIQIKRSSTASAVPLAGDLEVGELAVNLADKRLFTKKSDGTVVELSTNPTDIDIATLRIDGVEVTASAAEINALDGSTASTADLNKLAAVTATSTELNVLDGFTGSTAELNYVDGVTSNIQTQLDNKQPLDAQLTDIAGLTPTDGTFIVGNGTNFVAESGDTAIASLGVTATAAELNTLDGITATTTELNYTDGVTSNIQTQLDTKAPIASPTFTGTTTIPTVDINGGNIDGVQIGTASPNAGVFSTLNTNSSFEAPNIDDNGTKVDLKNGGVTKLATTATGVDVTGTITADGLTSNGDITVGAGQKFKFNDQRYFTPENNVDGAEVSANGKFTVKTGGTPSKSLVVDATGDVSFYEDTGTTAKMVWDASAESLGIGTSTPSTTLHVKSSTDIATFESTSSGLYNTFTSTAGTFGYLGSGSQTVSGTATTDFGIQAATGNFVVATGGNAERMRIDSSGNVGIGTSSPSTKLHIGHNNQGSTAGIIRIQDYDSQQDAGQQTGGIEFYTQDASIPTSGVSSAIKSFVSSSQGGAYLTFGTAANNTSTQTERMRIDSSGKLLVGTTSGTNSKKLSVVGDSGTSIAYIEQTTGSSSNDSVPALTLNRQTRDGAILNFEKSGSTVGSIGTNGGRPFFASTSRGLIFVGTGAVPCTTAGAYEDNIQDLGRADGRFDDVYATNGTINTSDRNEKQDIEVLNDAEQRVAQACKGLLRKFRWKDAVEEKGDDARIHFGIIAQDLQDAFTAEGLDAGRYAMFISSTWTDEETGEERTRLGVRYPELLAFIISAL